MLVLDRNVSETVTITVPPSTEPRVITVLYASRKAGGHIRLGFTADRDVVVNRSEVVKPVTADREA